MFRRRAATWLALLGVGLARPATAVAAEDADQCADAYELTQSEQLAGRLFEARRDARLCAAKCPAELAADCNAWEAQITAQIPSFVVHARGANGTPLLVKVVVDGAPATFTESGSIEVEPGRHRVEIRSSGMSVEKEVDLVAGVREQLVEVTISDQPPVAPVGLARATPARRPSKEQPPGAPPWRWALGGVGLATIVTGAGISISGEVLADQLRSECKPHCAQAQADEVVERWAIGGSLMGAGAALALAAALWPAGSSASSPTGGVNATRVFLGPRGIALAGAF